MKYFLTNNPPKDVLPNGFYYISQDNYYIANLNSPNPENPEKYLYSDSATSCIIIIVEGKDKANNPIIALAHLSRTERFHRFFEIVGENFIGACNVFAQGANPPQPAVKGDSTDYTSLQNTQTTVDWINNNIYVPNQQKEPPAWYFEECTLALGQGNPQIDDRGCYGIDLTTMIVSNQRYELTEEQRDPTGGVQVLFCVFGLQVNPPIVLPLSTDGFTDEQIDLLVQKANSESWTDILYMTKDEVLNKYSSTPQYEVPWFFDSLRISAQYVLAHSK
ncbi:MAG: hypothetical protein ED557_02670 [Balneola sp.]|nr:MAG: hypothetical protein ED557_02670 [Balneola sp.]